MVSKVPRKTSSTCFFPSSFHMPFKMKCVDSFAGVPVWNEFTTSLVSGVMEIAGSHLADEGCLVTLSLAEHLGSIVEHAERFSLKFHRSWTLMCDGGYLHPHTKEQVCNNT